MFIYDKENSKGAMSQTLIVPFFMHYFRRDLDEKVS